MDINQIQVLYFKNEFIVTWILHLNIVYSNEVKLEAGLNNDPPNPHPLPHPLLSYWMNKLTISVVYVSNLN